MALADMRMKMREKIEKTAGRDTMPYSYKKPPRGLLLARAIDRAILTPHLYSN